MKKLVLFFCGLLTTTSVYAIDLDAPPTPKQITTRSEIERGATSAFTCMNKMFGKDVLCVGDILQKEKTNNTDTDAFKLGASYIAWGLADIRSTQDNLMLKLAKSYYAEFHKIQLEFEINDKDLSEICHFGNEKTLQRLALYDNQ